MYSEHLDEFHGQRVIEFNGSPDWKGPQFAYRIREDYDDEISMEQRLASLLEQPGIDQLSSLIIGAWSGSCEGDGSSETVKLLTNIASRLGGLRHLFFGEMVVEECEISWINQSDVSPLLTAFHNLESFRVRGGTGLSFSKVKHDRLRELAVEAGGIGRGVIREIFLCDFPALEHLELLLGDGNYGFDGGVEDLQPLLTGQLFPRLKWLGLMNSEIANEIAAVIVNAPVVTRLETLSLSFGNLDSEGVKSLEGLAAFPNLKRLEISHHYASEGDIAALGNVLTCEIVAEDRQQPEDDWRPILHAE